MATALLVTIKKGKDAVKKARDFLTKPLKEHVKSIDSLFTPTLDALEIADTTARQKVVDYLRAEDDKRRQEQQRIDAENLKNRKAAKAMGEDAPVGKADAAEVQTKAATDEGSSTGTKYKDYEVVDIDKVPSQYVKKEIRRQEVLDALNKRGVASIPGLNIVDDFRLQVRR